MIEELSGGTGAPPRGTRAHPLGDIAEPLHRFGSMLLRPVAARLGAIPPHRRDDLVGAVDVAEARISDPPDASRTLGKRSMRS
jgi:hypothetical protein